MTPKTGGLSTLAIGFVVLGSACSPSASKRQGPAGQDAAAVPARGQPVSKEDRWYEGVGRAVSLSEALRIAGPEIEDERDAHSAGSGYLAYWMAKRGTFADVYTPKSETSAALVAKDSEAERGKRMCVSGVVAEIRKDEIHGQKLFTGLLLTWGQKIFFFFAAKSTGALVERSNAKFCGVVAAMYHYKNSGGGGSHAVELVGMFDLPENRTPSIAATKPTSRSEER